MKSHNYHPKNVSRSLVVVWFLFLILAALAPNPVKAQNPIDMLIIPSNNTIFAGDNFVVTVQIQAGIQSLNTAPLTLTESTVTSTSPVIINEIMIDPSSVSDTYGEWFELYNPTGQPIDLEGCVIRDNGSNTHTISNDGSLVIAAGDYLLIGRNADSAANGGVTVDYKMPFALSNTADEIILECGTVEYDRVEYDADTFPVTAGVSMELIDPARDNNIGGNWCPATNAWPDSAGDLGTPGAPNDCPTTAITLDAFTAAAGDSGVTVTWQTGTEIDNAGFNLYRATAQTGPYAKINPMLILAKGDAVSGASYSYLDTAATDLNQTYYYKLEDIDTSAVSTFHGPVNTASGVSGDPAAYRVYLPVICKKGSPAR